MIVGFPNNLAGLVQRRHTDDCRLPQQPRFSLKQGSPDRPPPSLAGHASMQVHLLSTILGLSNNQAEDHITNNQEVLAKATTPRQLHLHTDAPPQYYPRLVQ